MTDPFDELELGEAPPDEVGAEQYFCVEPGCNMALEYSGRGRKPKRCEEHKARTSPVREPGAPRPRRGMAARLEALQDDLTREMTLFGKATARVLPCFGITAVARAERTAAALCKIAADNPRVFEVLEVASKIAPALDLGETVAMLGIALLVDTGRLNPDGLLPSMFGISQTWHDVNDEPQEYLEPSMNGFPATDVPPRFQPVGATR